MLNFKNVFPSKVDQQHMFILWHNISFLYSMQLYCIKDSVENTQKTSQRHSSGGSWHRQNQITYTVDAKQCEHTVCVCM